MTERNVHEELLDEIKASQPEIEGFQFMVEDPIGNLVYTKVNEEGASLGTHYKILLGGDPEKVQEISFQSGNPADGVNGVTLETLINIAFSRTVDANAQIPHWHNNLVIDGLALAANVLDKRNADRIQAGVNGKDLALPRKGTEDMHPIVRRILTNQDKFNFILQMMIALSESHDDITDKDVQNEFIEFTPEGPKRLVETSPAEDEAITLGVATAQKLLAVFETSPLFQIILGTMVHGKKLMGEQAPSDTTPTAVSDEPQNDSTTETT